MRNCSDEPMTVPRKEAPIGPEWDSAHLGVWMDEQEPISVLNVTWKLKADAGLFKLQGSEIRIMDETTNQSMCVQFSFRINQVLNQEKWKFSMDGVVVEPGHTYTVSLFNLPEPSLGDYRISKQITIPGCSDRRIQSSLPCLQNGSLWDPLMSYNITVDREHKKISVIVDFNAAQYSEKYQVSIQNPGFLDSVFVFKENKTSLSVTFELGLWQLSQCEMLLIIQPFFIRCKNECLCLEKMLNYCPYYPARTLFIKAAAGLFIFGVITTFVIWRVSHKEPVDVSSSAAEEQTETLKFKERKRVLILYSRDHPLYENIILKLCAFLVNKCGTEVVLDLLDSARLGVLGSIQWLEWHREQIEKSSDKILILCSKGVQAKWRAMCGDKRIYLREDVGSPVGDTLSPALSLIIPHFIRSTSFKKYIVAYFNDISSEEDVPSPFHVTVRYKLMKQFEELFFRILDAEKHKPGRVNLIEGLSEGQCQLCPLGKDLQDAITTFHLYQVEHPHWFDDEVLESSELEVGESLAADTTATFNGGYEYDSSQIICGKNVTENRLYMTE
ncbi:interleukin-17 receptor A isoform X2 [Halichoeres trimaculatus]